jgi:hypothetical protein
VVKAGAALLGGDDAASVELEGALVGLDRHGNGLKKRGGQQDGDLGFGGHGGMLKTRSKMRKASPFRRNICTRGAGKAGICDLLVEGELKVRLILGDHVAEVADLGNLLGLKLRLAGARGAVARHVGVELLRCEAANLDDKVECVVHETTVATLIRGWTREWQRGNTSARKERGEAGAATANNMENVWGKGGCGAGR